MICPACETGRLVAPSCSTEADRARVDDEGWLVCSADGTAFTDDDLALYAERDA